MWRTFEHSAPRTAGALLLTLNSTQIMIRAHIVLPLLLLLAPVTFPACREPLRAQDAGACIPVNETGGAMHASRPASDTASSGFAVAELFTSEGCSSCPAADALFNTYVRTTSTVRDRLFLLAFHVDYWNRLGWRDRFSDAAYSARQQSYARTLGLDGIYTPQLVVNGSAECVGSDAGRVCTMLKDARAASRPLLLIDAQAEITTARDSVDVRYTLEKRGAKAWRDSGLVINCALVERGLHTTVAAGENDGRSLAHENVVRAFASVRLAPERDAVALVQRLAVPADVNLEHASVILYAQDRATGRVVGAVETAPSR